MHETIRFPSKSIRAVLLGLAVVVVLFSYERWRYSDGPGIASPGQASIPLARDLLTATGRASLDNLLQSGRLSGLRHPNFLKYRDDLISFYRLSGGRYGWVQDGRPTRQAVALANLLQSADHSGLDSEDYDGDRWAVQFTTFDKPGATEEELIRFDVGLSLSVIRYLSDLHRGRVDPHRLGVTLDTHPEDLQLAEFIAQLVDASDVEAKIRSVEPPFPAYRRTLAVLSQYLRLAREDSGVPLPKPSRALNPGSSYGGVGRMRELLRSTGDLQTSTATSGDLYTPDLVEAVRHFQSRHGLDDNGVLDATTIHEMNVPLGKRVSQLRLTLERWRWAPRRFERPPIVVNIPEFRLHTNDRDFHWGLNMKVVVGRAFGHQTPVFASDIQAIIFRPRWDVPISIQRNEISPQVAKDPSYLAKHGYEVLDQKGNVVSGMDRDLAKELSYGHLRVRQKAGPEDALGLIKFEFPNSYGVYMHGTPAPELFSRTRRDFSHGCIRLEDPVLLARWLLSDRPDWPVQRILAAMNGSSTVRVNLAQPVPVFIVYGTAVVMENGEVHFLRDIYQNDAVLEKLLMKQKNSSW